MALRCSWPKVCPLNVQANNLPDSRPFSKMHPHILYMLGILVHCGQHRTILNSATTLTDVHGRGSASSHNQPRGDIIHQLSLRFMPNVISLFKKCVSCLVFLLVVFLSPVSLELTVVQQKPPTPSLGVCVHSSLVVRRYWQSHNVAWRNGEALTPSSIFQRSFKVLNLSARPLPPLAIIDPSGLRWMCEYGTRLFIYSPTPQRVLELLVPAV